MKKDMHDVSNAINNLDPSKGTDKGICKQAQVQNTGSDEGKCNNAGSSAGSQQQLSAWFNASNTNWNTADKKIEKWGEHNAGVVAKDISTNLTRDQKGVVSSAFAKAHEGAEIVEIRSISTTSVMVNACYDVLAEGLPVSPYGCAGIMIGYQC